MAVPIGRQWSHRLRKEVNPPLILENPLSRSRNIPEAEEDYISPFKEENPNICEKLRQAPPGVAKNMVRTIPIGRLSPLCQIYVDLEVTIFYVASICEANMDCTNGAPVFSRWDNSCYVIHYNDDGRSGIGNSFAG
jgi:hypothetical protein